MPGLQYAPGMAYVSGGGSGARHFAIGLILWYLECGAAFVLLRAAWKAHKRGLARVRRFNERHTPKHARRK